MEWINYKGYSLRAPKGFLDSEMAVSGSCGPGTGFKEKIIPDSILGVSIKPACAIHDYCYKIFDTEEEKIDSDLELFANAIRIINQKSKSKILSFFRSMIVSIYFLAVFYGGDKAFKY